MTPGEDDPWLEQRVQLSAGASIIARSIFAGRHEPRPLDELVRLSVDASDQGRMVAAANPATPVELLLRLATDKSPDVVEITAAHPNATAAVLDRLVSDQLERRKARLSESQGSHHWSVSRSRYEFPLGALEVVASNPSTSQESLRTLADSVDWVLNSLPAYRNEADVSREVRVWAGIAGNPSAPADLLDQIARQVHKLQSTQENPNHIERGGGLEGLREATLRKIVENSATSVETLEFLSSGDWVARRTTTKSEREYGQTTTWLVWDGPATDAAAQDMASLVRQEISRRQWSGSSSTMGRYELAANPDTASEVLDQLSIDGDVDVRCEVASNPSTGPQAFERLAADPAVEVRLSAAEASHPDAASAKYDTKRFSTASREDLYRSAYEQLACDRDPAVRAAVAENIRIFWKVLSTEARDRYAFDDDPGVRTSLLDAIADANSFDGMSSDALIHLIDTSGAEVWRRISAFFSLDEAVLSRLVETGDTETIIRIIDSSNASPALVTRLAASGDLAVVAAVAAMKFRYYIDEPEKDALELALLTNPLTPGNYLLRLPSELEQRIAEGQWEPNEEFDSAIEAINETLRESGTYVPSPAEKRETRKVRAAEAERRMQLALAHPNFPEEALIEYVSGTNEKLAREAVRRGGIHVLVAAASNPSSTAEILNDLATRTDPEVRQALLVNKSTPPDLLVRLIQSGTT